MTALDARGVTHQYGEHRSALTDVTFELGGGTTALLGVNGAGKSTLLRALAGAQQPTSGTIRVGGKNPYARAERSAALAGIALMPQLASFPAPMTVREVLVHIGWLRGLSPRDAKRRAAWAAEQVDLAPRLDTRMKALSGGMQRRVALAQALLAEPAVILLDEPSTGLDPQQRRLMVDLVRRLDATILFSSHVIEDVLDVADRVLVLESGRLVLDDSLDALVERGSTRVLPTANRAERAEAGFLSLVTSSAGAH